MYAQTDSLERVALRERVDARTLSESEFSKTWNKWNLFVKENKYPDLPLDQNGQVHYNFIKNFPGMDSEKLFHRILEWMAVNYGIIPASVYSNLNDGKIILRNNLNLNSVETCIFTSVFSIKNEKIRSEFFSIIYQNGSDLLPEITISRTIDQLYPVILTKNTEWKSNILLLKRINDLFDREIQNLYDYIGTYDHSNEF
jgi:hypothetical protein